MIRGLDEDVLERLKARAKRHGRSVEAEAREILIAAANGEGLREEGQKEGFGTRVRKKYGSSGLTREEWDELDRAMDGESSESEHGPAHRSV